MPNLDIHCKLSKRRTGRSFEELHRWMDIYAQTLGVDHRSERHAYTIAMEKQVHDYYEKKERGLGNIAVEEWLFHIALDNLHTLHKKMKHNHPMETRINLHVFGFTQRDYSFYEGLILEDKEIYEFFKYLREKGVKT